MAEAEFDAFAASYDEDLRRGLALTGEGKSYYARRRLTWLAGRLATIGLTPRRVLDLGCGTGTSAPLLHEILGAERVVGVDPSDASLARARAEYGGPATEFMLPSQCTPDESFDLVFMNGVLHHVPPEQRPSLLREVVAWLRPGGVFACWENNPLNPGTRWIMRRVAFDRDAMPLRAGVLRALVTGAGLELLRVDFLFIFPRVLRFLRGFEPALARLPFGGQYEVLARKSVRAVPGE